jgi:hypothetical protein
MFAQKPGFSYSPETRFFEKTWFLNANEMATIHLNRAPGLLRTLQQVRRLFYDFLR